jgi:parvulin-like peptidyl-prolyl isomerase
LSNTQTEALATPAGRVKKNIGRQQRLVALARNNDDGSAKSGGDLAGQPWRVVPEFRKVMDTLALNQISDPSSRSWGNRCGAGTA